MEKKEKLYWIMQEYENIDDVPEEILAEIMDSDEDTPFDSEYNKELTVDDMYIDENGNAQFGYYD